MVLWLASSELRQGRSGQEGLAHILTLLERLHECAQTGASDRRYADHCNQRVRSRSRQDGSGIRCRLVVYFHFPPTAFSPYFFYYFQDVSAYVKVIVAACLVGNFSKWTRWIVGAYLLIQTSTKQERRCHVNSMHLQMARPSLVKLRGGFSPRSMRAWSSAVMKPGGLRNGRCAIADERR